MKRQFKIETVSAISQVDAASWNRLVTASSQLPPFGGTGYGNPFMRHEFLASLEESGSATARTGWAPRHLLLRDEAGDLRGAAVLYQKSHSQGEYVFDHGWADAFERAGGRYYPKLQCAAPFTPASGPRLLHDGRSDRETVQTALLSGMRQTTDGLGVSSAHITFMTEPEWRLAGQAGFLLRTDRQFHWSNDGYSTFEDFLSRLSSRKRKNIRKERESALCGGTIQVEWLSGADLTEAIWDRFFEFYMDTGSRKWGRPYLNREFYSLVGKRMGERIVLMMARRDGRLIAGAINFLGDDCLYGRHWGCIEDHPCLHFEVCYYQAIEYAILKGLARVEAGAQGEHKIARGYEPVITHSAHHIAHPGLRRAVDDYLEKEREHVALEAEILAGHTPFRRNGN